MANTLVLGLTGLVFCTWVVSLAGIASIQDKCEPGWSDALSSINGFTSGLACMATFRYYWFIVCAEFALIVAVGVGAVGSLYSKARLSFLGLACICTLLYIEMTDAFMGMWNVSEDMSGSIVDRVRVMVAGCIMTSVVNCFLVIALGLNPEEPHAAPVESGKAASAV